MLLFDDFVADFPPGPATAQRQDWQAPLVSVSSTNLATGQPIRVITPLTAHTRGVLLTLNGDCAHGQMVLKTATMRPTQCYRTTFSVTPRCQTVNLLWADFHPVGGLLRRTPRAEAIHNYAIAPDVTGANLLIKRVRFY